MTDASTNDAPDRSDASARADAGPTDTTATDAAPPPPGEPTTERQTLLVSVAIDTDEEARIKEIGARVLDEGWRVVQAIPLSGGEAGPGGESEDFMRYQVTVEREVDAQGVIANADRGDAARLKDVGQVSAAFDGPLPGPDDEA